jgi:hypothetical protein
MPYVLPDKANGSNSQAPQVMSGFADPDYLYGIHVKLDGHCLAFRWHRPTDTMETVDISTLVSNRLEMPLFDIEDGHYILTVGVTWDDLVYIVGNHHDHLAGIDNPHLIRCNDVTDFTNPASWVAPAAAYFTGLDNSVLDDTYTYHSWERTTDGSLIHMLSQSEGGGDFSVGRDILAFINLTGTTTWTPLISGAPDGHFATTPVDYTTTVANRVYINGLHVEAGGDDAGTGDRIWVLLIWRTDNEEANSQQAPLVAYCDMTDRTTWYGMDGAARTIANGDLPFHWDNRADAEVTPDISPTTRYGVAVDPANHEPSILTVDGIAGPLVRWRWDSNTSAWVEESPTDRQGFEREFFLDGERWVRYNDAGRMALTRISDETTVYMGNAVQASGSVEPNWCPVWLREQGVIAFNVGNGDEPLVWTFGDGATRSAFG